MRQVLTHPVKLENVCFEYGTLKADDVILPDTDCRLVGAVVLHQCNGDPLDGIEWITTTPTVRQDGEDTVICVEFDLSAEDPDITTATDELTITKDMTACEKLAVMRCCQDLLYCGLQKKEITFDGRRVSYTTPDDARLTRRIVELEELCNRERGCIASETRISGHFNCG